MTVFRSIRTPLALTLALAAFGCGGNNDELTVRGEAAVTFAPDYVERFAFDADTQLQRDGLAAGSRVYLADTARCRRLVSPEWTWRSTARTRPWV